MALTADEKLQYERDGFLIFRKAFPDDVIKRLRGAVEKLLARGLRDEVELRWIDRDAGVVARIAGMLKATMYDEAYGQWHDDYLIDMIEPIVGGPCRHSLFGMLASGGGKGYVLSWHRDLTAPDDATMPAVVAPSLPQPSAQFNAPLLADDSFLEVVPGSHARESTDDEKAFFHSGSRERMPGAVTVELQPGDIAIYNALIWHRGYNPQGKLRWSMHAAYWQHDAPIMSHERGQVEDLTANGNLDRMSPRLREIVQRYIDLHPPEGVEAPTLYDVFRQRSAGGAAQ